MRNKYLMLFMVMVLVAGAFLVGCGGSKDSDNGEPTNGDIVNGDNGDLDNGDNGDDDKGDIGQPGLTGDWIDLGNFVRVVRTAEWRYDDETFHYTYEGKDNVGGVETEVAKIVAKEDGWPDEVLTIWVDGDGKVVQAKFDDDMAYEDELEYVHFFAIPPLMPFYAFEADFTVSGFTAALAGQSGSDWEVLRQKSGKESIGGKSITVYTVELKTKWDAEEEQIISFKYGDFGPFKLLLSWETLDGYEEIFETVSISFR